MRLEFFTLLWFTSAAIAVAPPKSGVGETPETFERHYQLPPMTECRLNPSPLAGMEKVLSTIDIGGHRFFTAVGIVNGKVADYRSLPLDARADGSDCAVKCFNRDVTVTCRDAAQKPREFRYFWSNDSLTLIRRTGTDETEVAVRNLFSQMQEGAVPPTCENIRAIRGVDQPKYSGPDRLHAELMKAHTAAQKLAKEKKFTESATRLANAFTTTTRLLCCSGWLQCPDNEAARPKAWVDARAGGRNPANLYWVAYPIPNSQYLDAFRDYGTYLDQSGEHLKAIEIFKLALDRDRQNTDLHLGLADAFWAAGDHNSGADEYRAFADIFAKTRALPKRVKQRMRK